jgi:hypothetical protein
MKINFEILNSKQSVWGSRNINIWDLFRVS